MVIFMDGNKKHTKGSGDEMPTVEKVYYEMTCFLQELDEYIENYKKLPEEEAKKRARQNLIDIGMIDEQGNLTDFYKDT